MTSDQVEWLSWRGYSERKPISLAGWTQGFAFPSRFYERVPFCIESYSQMNLLDSDLRLEMQKQMLDKTNHSVMAAIYPGLIRSEQSIWLHEQISIAFRALLKLVLLTFRNDLQSEELGRVLACLSPETSRHLRSALASSLYYYANATSCRSLETLISMPFFIELGVDVLAHGLNFALAEFQVRYSTPYPHLLDDMSDAYADLFPEIFEKFQLQKETFCRRRNRMLLDSINAFADRGTPPSRLVIDAWAYLENSGANLKPTAKALDADYILFDDLMKGPGGPQKLYRGKRLAIFNQPPLNLLDPDHAMFESVSAERLEWYDELAWEGLVDRYINGDVFAANPPATDIANDKALYSVLPDLARIFFGETLELPVLDMLPCWSEEDFRKPHEAVLARVKNNKNDFVIAHRYLEGGLGIRVGATISQNEWDNFIDTFVTDRPYLYIVRNYFRMDPDFSLRSLVCASLPSAMSAAEECRPELSDTLYARLTTDPPLSTDNHRSFLVFPVVASSAQPRYKLEHQDLRNR